MTDDLLSHVLTIVSAEVGTREVSRNRGPRVDDYIRAVGLKPEDEHPWCAAFVYWAFAAAARTIGTTNPCPRTASALRMWTKAAPECRIRTFGEGHVVDPERIRPGAVFVLEKSHGKGHVGIVEGVDLRTKVLTTIEGNTDGSGSREGDGVYRRQRKMSDVNLGYLAFDMLAALDLPPRVA